MFNPKAPLCIVDTETGGLQLRHPIIQIAAVVVLPAEDWREIDSLQLKLTFDPAACEKEALAVNHYTPEAWKGAVEPGEAIGALARLFERHRSKGMMSKAGKPYRVAVAAGYNAPFDSERIFKLARERNLFLPVSFHWLCAMQLAFWKGVDVTSFKLTEVAKALGLDPAGAHDALVDVRLTAQVLRRLLSEAK